jgi:hypothetical protein
MTHAGSPAGREMLERLRAASRQIEATVGPPATLDPTRELATSLVDVHARALAQLDASFVAPLVEPLADGLYTLALAQLDAFPGNLFWDLDLIAVAIVAQVRGLPPEHAAVHIADQFARMAELQHLYGRATAINFAYVHDFVYGYDWAKWVAREPDVQADVPEPFAPRFLAYMRTRAHELLELIAVDDAKYPSLVDDQARNPFPFSRAPADEITLHRELARRDLIPVPTWNPDANSLNWSTRWQLPFQAVRIAVARDLGLLRDQSGIG